MKTTYWRVAVLLFIALLACPVLADFTFVQITDTHIEANPGDPSFVARYEEAIRRINELNPAFVIHTGDALANFSVENAARFKAISAQLKPKLYVVPGNHDVGNKVIRDGPVTQDSYDAWVAAWGPGRVAFEQEGCVFVGLTSVLFSSRLAEASEQYEWLKSQLKSAGKKRVFVFLHHPVFENSPGEPSGQYNNLDEPERSDFLRLIKKHKAEAVLYGHLHRCNESYFGGTAFIGSPGLSFSVVADKGQTGYRVFRVAPGGFTTQFIDLRVGGEPPRFGK